MTRKRPFGCTQHTGVCEYMRTASDNVRRDYKQVFINNNKGTGFPVPRNFLYSVVSPLYISPIQLRIFRFVKCFLRLPRNHIC